MRVRPIILLLLQPLRPLLLRCVRATRPTDGLWTVTTSPQNTIIIIGAATALRGRLSPPPIVPTAPCPRSPRFTSLQQVGASAAEK